MTCPSWLQYRWTLAAGVSCGWWLSVSGHWLAPCVGGPGVQSCQACRDMVDFDGDGDVDLFDAAEWQTRMSDEGPQA